MFSKISVLVRVRPPVLNEKKECAIQIESNKCQLKLNNVDHSFAFDAVRGPEVTQEEFSFGHISATIDEFIKKGVSGAIIAYGQTASGKTYTMTGDGKGSKNNGVIQRSLQRIFTEEPKIELRCAFVEIYNDRVFDLLHNRQPIQIQQDGSLKNASQIKAHNMQEIENILNKGTKMRSTAQTNMNSNSSRSHSILKIITPLNAELNLVDLAGSETVGKSGASGEVLKEAGFINSSLSTLANVIKQLGSGSQHISYRDSKLTHALKKSFEGVSRTTLIINLSPLEVHLRESLNSLRFGMSAKEIPVQRFSKHERSKQIDILWKVMMACSHSRRGVEVLPTELRNLGEGHVFRPSKLVKLERINARLE